jgi:hypothetical protein
MATKLIRMLVYLRQLLLNEMESVLREARHEHSNHDAWARSLLQQAIYLSSHLM